MLNKKAFIRDGTEQMSPKVNAIANGYTILKYLSTQNTSPGVTKIATETNISPSSCFNILKTLVQLNLATFDKTTKGYDLGFAVVELAQHAMLKNPIIHIARPYLTDLAERYNGFAGLWEVSSHNGATLMAIEEKTAGVRLNIQVGYTQGAGAGSVGRIVLSQFLNNPLLITAAFNKVNWEGEITLEEYIEDLRLAAKRGYSIDRNKLFLGATTVSTLIPKQNSGRQYCLSFFSVSERHSAKTINEIGRETILIAQRIFDIRKPTN